MNEYWTKLPCAGCEDHWVLAAAGKVRCKKCQVRRPELDGYNRGSGLFELIPLAEYKE